MEASLQPRDYAQVVDPHVDRNSSPISNRPLITVLGWRLPTWPLDIGPVAFVVVVGMAAIVFRPDRSAASAWVLVLGLTTTSVALLLRHRAPLAVLVLVLIVAFGLNYGPLVTLPVLLAVFTVAEYTERSRVIGAAIAAAAVIIATPAIHGQTLTVAQVLSRLVAIGLAVAVGLYLRARADYVIGLHERAERLERERELLAQQAVGDERVRIARELHDVVAHNVSLMVVQAQALAATAASEGGEQHAALDRIAGLGRDALSEMHRMLGVLRLQNGAAAEREPQPGVRDLETLIARTRAAGLDAQLLVEGEPHELPAAVDLSAYRIVQEALTNVVKHAAADHALVRLNYEPRALHVTVVDDGSGGAPTAANGSADAHQRGAGERQRHGLVGMRERVALFGGELEAAPQPDGRGFRVSALLPMD
jgi:signal transduction histidine kinase